MAFFGAILLLLTAVLVVVNTTIAQVSSGIRINEIMWDGTEYLELLNTGEDEVLLADWYITRQRSEGEAEETIVTLSETNTIPSQGYFLIAKNDSAGSFTADATSSGLVLRNEGELIRLYTDEGELVDSANRFGAWYAGQNTETGISMERIGGDGIDASAWQTSTGNSGGRFGTPGSENSEAEEIPTVTPETSVTPSISPSPPVESSPTVVPTLTPLPTPYTREIYISEFLPNPIGSDTTGEFIEIINAGSEVVDLTNWSLDDEVGGSSLWKFPAGTLIEGGEILVWSRSETGISLNNDVDQVRLLDPDGAVAAIALYAGNISEGVAYIQSDSGEFIQTLTPTPGEDNVLTTPTPSPTVATTTEPDDEDGQLSDDIVINEFLVNPVGSDTEKEYIEVRNIGSETISLNNWKLDDDEGGSKAYKIPNDISLEPQEIMVFMRSDTGISLNNSSDSARILDPAGEVISKGEYEESVPEGYSYNRTDGDEYVLSNTLTPGKPNIITSDKEELQGVGGSTSIIKLADVRSEEVGTVITTEGVVSVPPHLLGKGIFYVAGSGIQVYSSGNTFPALKMGDKVRITGEYGTLAGEGRIKINNESSVVLLEKSAVPEPHILNTGDVQEDDEGSVVKIEGEVVRSAGSTFYVDDGTGEVRIVVKSTTNIDKPSTPQGTRVSITGIVSETQSGYRILPRFQDDIQVLSAVAGTKKVAASSKKAVTSIAKSLTSTSNTIAKASFSDDPLQRAAIEAVKADKGRLPRFIVMTAAAMLATIYILNGLGYEEPLLSFLRGSQ